MSIFPCDVHGAIVRGLLDAIYLTVLDGTSRFSRKLRICNADLDNLLGVYESAWVKVEIDGQMTLDSSCAQCHAEFETVTPQYPLFATAYRKGTQRTDYFANLCQKCAQEFKEHWNLQPA